MCSFLLYYIIRVSEHFKYKNQVVAFKKFDEKRAVYEGELSVKNLEAFLRAHSVARVVSYFFT